MMVSDGKILDQIFNLKFTAKQLSRSAVKAEKEEKSERLKVKKALEKGNKEGAMIYGQNAIRKKNEALNFLKLASRLDAVVSRLETQAKMNLINKSFAGIVKSLEKALNANNLEQVSQTMDQFERQFESLDVQSAAVETAMSNSTSLTTPAEEVNALLQQVAEEHNIEFNINLPSASTAVPAVAAPAQAVQAQPETDLSRRFAELKART